MLLRSLNTIMITFCILATVGVFFVAGCESDDSSSGTIIVSGGTDSDKEDPVDKDGNGDPVQPEPPDPVVVDGKLEKGSRVKVTNTIVDGVDKRLFIREDVGRDSDEIGSAADGATGTIVAGPVIGDDWIWFEVLWDDNGKVAFNEGHDCCFGWSAESDINDVVRYLTEIP